MKRLLLTLIVFFSFDAYGSGGVTCSSEQKLLPVFGISWSTGRVVGNGRFSPYRLTLSGREIAIVASKDSESMRKQIRSGEKLVELTEVGHWNHDGRIMVLLADDHVSQIKLKLEVTRSKGDVFTGRLSVGNVEGVSVADHAVACVVE